MPTDAFQIRGNDFDKAARDLHRVGRRDLEQRLRNALRQAAAPGIAAAKSGAEEILPHRGGLAGRVAASKFGVHTSTGDKLSVSVTVTNKYAVAAMNRGRLRHRVFGRDVWVFQKIRPGWFTTPLKGAEPVMRVRIEKALRDIQSELHN